MSSSVKKEQLEVCPELCLNRDSRRVQKKVCVVEVCVVNLDSVATRLLAIFLKLVIVQDHGLNISFSDHTGKRR